MKTAKIRIAACKRLSLLAAFVVLAWALSFQCGMAATYYVRTDGNDSNTGTGSSASEAWRTLDHAAKASLAAGDFVYVRAGTYAEKLDVAVQGTSSNPIHFIADTNGSVSGWTAGEVLIDASSSGEAIKIDNQDHVYFARFKVRGQSGSNVLFLKDATGIGFERCELYDGSTGAAVENCTATFINCLFRNNSGDGIQITTGGNAIVYHCTIVANGDDGIDAGNSSATVVNSIIANNSDFGFSRQSDGDGTLSNFYNLLHNNSSGNYNGATAGFGELTSDPLFVSANDYQLQVGSPAIDSGGDLTGTVSDDLLGTARPSGSGWDMGCYEVSSADLDAQWLLNETSGTSAADSSGASLDGTYTGGVTLNTSGPFPGAGAVAADFDGTDDHVDLPDINTDFSQGFSAAFWFNPASTPAVEADMLGISNGQDVDDIWIGWLPGTGMELYFSDTTDGSSSRWLDDNVEPVVGKWQHFAATVDASGNAKIYRNGVEVASGFVSLPSNVNRTENFIGTSVWNEEFEGQMFDVRAYNRELTAAEVSELYGLTGHWTFDEGSGTTIADSSGNANHASFNTGTPAWIQGIYGNALEFDGTNDAITGSAFDPAAEGAVALWIRSDGPPASRQRPWGLGADFEMWQDTDGLVSMDISTDGFQGGFITTTPLYTAGTWYHIVAQYDSNDDSYEIYLNGELHKSGISTWAIVEQAANQLSFGTRTGSSQRFSGAIDDFRIYNRKLSLSEVTDLYGLIGHWKMDEGSGTNLNDSTGNANHATISGASWTSDCVGNIGLEFDGLNDYAATGAAFAPPDAGTVAFWMRGADTPTARGRLFGVNGNWEARQETDGSSKFDLGASPFAGNEPFTTPIVDDIDRWYHIIAIYDVSDDSYSVYTNGALTASGISPVDLVSQAAGVLSFGTRTGSTEYWIGAMRDFRVYNRPITQGEIAALTGLVGYWKLDESSGTVASDSSPSGNDGTLVGSPTWTTAGQVDGALDFETSDGEDRVDVGTFDVSGNEISIAAWVRPENGSTDQRIIIKGNSTSLQDQYWGMAVGASMELDFRLKAGGTTEFFTETNVLSPGKWNHVAGTYDGTTMRMYVNGNEVRSVVHSVGGALDQDGTTPVTLGAANVSGRAFDGRLDDIRVLSRLMCQEEIRGLYRGGRPAGVRILKWVEVR